MLKRLSFFILIICSTANIAVAQARDQEANLKAVFIYNFTKYIEWENAGPDNRFIIGILGSSPLESSISEIARTNLAKNKRITLKQFSSADDISYCKILFIPRTSKIPLQSVLEKVGKGVLVISEEPGLARQGSAINFVLNNDKLKFEINLKALYSAGLKASSQLLKLATIVD